MSAPSLQPTPSAAPDRRADRRARILAAARTAAARDGFVGVTMDAIASGARVSKGTLYNHFPSKEALLLEMVITDLVAGGAIVAQHITDTHDARAALRGVTDGLVAMVGARAGGSSLLYQAWAIVAESPEMEDQLRVALQELFRNWSRLTREVVERGQRGGEFPADVDAGVVADAISALVSGFLYRASFDEAAASPERLRAMFEALVHERLC